MTSMRKIIKKESDAYAAMQAASADLLIRVLEGIDDEETARLKRRSQAYRVQWEAAARTLEDEDLKQREVYA